MKNNVIKHSLILIGLTINFFTNGMSRELPEVIPAKQPKPSLINRFRNLFTSSQELEQKEFERESGFVTKEKSQNNAWLTIKNAADLDIEISVEDNVNKFSQTLKPNQSMDRLVRLVGVTSNLSTLTAEFTHKNNILLYLDLFRNEHADSAQQNADLSAYLFNHDRTVDNTVFYDDTNNNYVININLAGADLDRSTIAVVPATTKHLLELKEREEKKTGGIIKKLERTGSKILPKTTPR